MSSKENVQQHVDEVFEKAGPFIRYQVVILTACTYLTLVTSYNNVLPFFTGDNPSWKCTGNISSSFCKRNFNETIFNGDVRFGKRCNLNRSEWTFTSELDYSYLTEFDLVCEKTWLASLIGSSYYVGGVFGSSVSGIAADAFGRKPVILVALLVGSVSLVVSSFITDIWQLVVLNLCRGAGTYVSYVTCFVYQSEFAPPKFRAIASNILQVGFSTSFFLIDLFAYYFRHWRILTRYLTLPCLPAIIMFCFLPETPRWLLVNGKRKRAMDIIEKVSRTKCELPIGNGGIKDPVISDQKKYTFADLFRNPTVLKLTLAIGILWSVLPIGFYTIALESSSLGGNMYQAFALSNISDYFAYFISAVLCNRIGRKRTIIGGLFISSIFLILLIIIRLSISSRYTINLILTSLARLSNNVSGSGVFVWMVELFPTILRSRGVSFCAFCDRIAVIFVPFITGPLQDVSPILPYAIVSILVVGGGIIGLSLPETLNKPTRETYEDFFPNIRISPSTEGVSNNGMDNENEQVTGV